MLRLANTSHLCSTAGARLDVGGSRGSTKREAEDGEERSDVPQESERAGIEITVKSAEEERCSTMQLSGGERALTSIALIFAMSQVNPPPFAILDETDAALDEANSRRYGDMIGEPRGRRVSSSSSRTTARP